MTARPLFLVPLVLAALPLAAPARDASAAKLDFRWAVPGSLVEVRGQFSGTVRGDGNTFAIASLDRLELLSRDPALSWPLNAWYAFQAPFRLEATDNWLNLQMGLPPGAVVTPTASIDGAVMDFGICALAACLEGFGVAAGPAADGFWGGYPTAMVFTTNAFMGSSYFPSQWTASLVAEVPAPGAVGVLGMGLLGLAVAGAGRARRLEVSVAR